MENQTYIIAGLHKHHGVVKLDRGVRYTLEEAEVARKRLLEECDAERKILGFTMFVVYNLMDETMEPPFRII